MRALRLNTEEDAWAALKEIHNETFDTNLSAIEFGEWADFSVRLPNETGPHISTDFMEVNLSIQRLLRRTYAAAIYGHTDLRRISRHESESLTVKVEVRPGSSMQRSNTAQLLSFISMTALGMAPNTASAADKVGLLAVDGDTVNHTVDKALEAFTHLDPSVQIASIIGVSLLLGGTTAWAQWLRYKATTQNNDVEKARLDLEKQRLDREKERVEEEFKRLMLLKPGLETAIDETIHKLTSAATREEIVEINGTPVSGAEIKDRAQTRKRKSSKIH